VIIFDGNLSPALSTTDMKNFDSLNAQMINISTLGDLDLSISVLEQNLIHKTEKIYENLKLVIITGFSKLVAPCELMNNKGYKIIKKIISRIFVQKFITGSIKIRETALRNKFIISLPQTK
jgi:hypothetical protein